MLVCRNLLMARQRGRGPSEIRSSGRWQIAMSASGRLEMAQYLACVVLLPGLVGVLRRVLLVEADEQVHQLAADGPTTQQARKFRQVDQPLRIPGSPVIVRPVDDPE